MRKFLLGMLAIVAMVATSCQKETDLGVNTGETVSVSINVATPTRAYSDGKTATVLQYAVYDANGAELTDLTKSLANENAKTINTSTTVELQLVTGNTYTVIFWAAAPNAPYAVDFATKTMSVNYEAEKTACNDEARDAFFGKHTFTVNGAQTETIELRRPFAQLNIGTADYTAATNAGYTPTQSAVVVKNIYSTLDLATGAVDNEIEANFGLANIKKDETFPVTGFEYLAMNYLLVSAEQETVEVEFTYTDGSNAKTRTVGSVPVQRNYRTNIYGSLLTSNVAVNVEIKPEYVDEYNGEGNGYFVKDGNYYIVSAEGLKWVSEQVNTMEYYVNQAANIFDNKTVYLANDIDLDGEEWRPIGDYAFSRTSFNGVFDGQGHTISNFKVTEPVRWTEKVSEASYGFFGNVKGTIKNLTIKNATVNPEGGRYSAAVVGRLHNGGVIENCHVVNSSVTINHWQVGGIVGQNNNGNISGCSVVGSTITGKAAVGAIIGMDMTAGEHFVTDCRVANTALVQNASFGASYDASYGLIVGLANASGIVLNINDVTVENNTIMGVASSTLVGDKEEGVTILVNGATPVATAEELDAAIKAGGNYILLNDVAVTSKTYQNIDFILDGNGYTISQVEGSANEYGLFDSVTGKITIKNVTFDGIKKGAVIRSVGAELTLDNITVKNCEHTQIYGMFRLIGKNVIKNSTFVNNTCTTVITFNTEGDNNTDPQLVQNCVFKNNTCSATAVVHYSTGGSATIDGNKFLNNTLNVSNGATVYLGFKKNCTVTNNVFDGNTVTATSKRSAGGLMVGNAAVVTGNCFVNNTLTVNGQTGYGNDVCASPYYAAIDLSGNYWGGGAPVEGDDYYKEYNNYEVIINDYLTTWEL